MTNFHLPLCHCHQFHLEMQDKGAPPACPPACTKMHNLCQNSNRQVQCANERRQPLGSDTHPHTIQCSALVDGWEVGGCHVEWVGARWSRQVETVGHSGALTLPVRCKCFLALPAAGQCSAGWLSVGSGRAVCLSRQVAWGPTFLYAGSWIGTDTDRSEQDVELDSRDLRICWSFFPVSQSGPT